MELPTASMPRSPCASRKDVTASLSVPIDVSPRKDGVLLRIEVSARLVKDDGKPGTIGMWAAGSSTLTSTFSNTGGSIRFAGLVAQTGPDYTGESMDLAGTLEWTCGAAPVVTP